MVPKDLSGQIHDAERRLPPDLERKLQLCEGIVERMRVLQEQVDWELRRSVAAPTQIPYEAAPAIRLAVSGVLRWIVATLKPSRG